MAIRRRKPETCPRCGYPYAARVPKKSNQEMKLARMYRHYCKDAVYLHWIDHEA